jgi:hypothetical protein
MYSVPAIGSPSTLSFLVFSGKRNVIMIQSNRVLKLADSFSFQKLGDGDGAVVLEVKSGQLHTCNDTTAEFLAALDGNRTFAMVVDQLEGTFEVDREVLTSDLAELAKTLEAQQVIV